MTFQENCPERYWQKGMRQLKDLGMPERSWGEFLPGDEPGWMCKIECQGCAESPKDCPLFEKRHEGIYRNGDLYWNEFTDKFWYKEEEDA